MKISIFLRKNNFNLVHVSGGSWQYKGFFAAKLSNIKVIWHLNDTYTPFIFRLLFGLFGKYADSYIFASYRTKNYYYKFCDKKKDWVVIPAPINTNKFLPGIINSPSIGLKWQGKVVIGMVANINPVKGIDVFIKAVKLLDPQIFNAVFIIIGPVYDSQNEYFNALNNNIGKKYKDSIIFVGPKKDVRPWLKLIDIYVCTSNFESSPTSVWEAMSMEKPIISTDVGDVSLYVENDKNGYIVPTGDYHSLADRIIHLINNPDKVLKFGMYSRKIAINNFDISICSKMHIKAYNSTYNFLKV